MKLHPEKMGYVLLILGVVMMLWAAFARADTTARLVWQSYTANCTPTYSGGLDWNPSYGLRCIESLGYGVVSPWKPGQLDGDGIGGKTVTVTILSPENATSWRVAQIGGVVLAQYTQGGANVVTSGSSNFGGSVVSGDVDLQKIVLLLGNVFIWLFGLAVGWKLAATPPTIFME